MVFSSQSNLLFFKRIFKPPNLSFSPLFSKPLSSLPQSPPLPDPPKSNLSSRMSFVFDQIDAIEREQGEKFQTLQRIRAWRESKNINSFKENVKNDHLGGFEGRGVLREENGEVGSGKDLILEGGGVLREENGEVGSDKDLILEGRGGNGEVGSEEDLVLVHPWPEWMELVERLVQQNYFDHKRRDEDKMMDESGFRLGEEGGGKFDFSKDWRTVETAVLNFGRDRFDILRSLSRKDLQILVGYGCPSRDKKTTFAAKVLRKYVHLDEGDVCSSCSLRTSCERAYLLTNKEDEARTIDVMRILLTYGFDPINGPIMNKSLLKLKSVKTIVRKLLHQVVKLSAVPIDPNLPPPVFKKPPPKVKIPPPPPRKRVGRDDIEMKKGDWLCSKCDFMNFAKNTICLQCDAKRPKRQLLPGEWECPQCNFLNYRRNVVCFHCECKRPHDEYMESQMQEKQAAPRMRPGKVINREEVSNAWNFNFDDDESDGADVAAFEYADSNKLNEDYQGGYNKSGQTRMYERNNSPPTAVNPGAGFNDFSDDDDVDNYELDNRNEAERASRVDFSELEADSESDLENGDSSRHASRRTSLNDRKKPARPGNPTFSRSEDADLDFGSDDDLPAHPNWKSSHVANPRQNTRHGGALSFGSDDDLGSDDEGMGGGFNSSRRVQGRQGGNRNRSSSDFESDDEQDFHRDKRTGAGSRSVSSRGGPVRGGRGQFSGTDYPKYSRNSGRSSFDGQISNDRRGNSQSFGRGQGRSHNRASSDFESDDEQDFHRAKRTGAGSRGGSSRGGPSRGGRGQFSGSDSLKYSRNERDGGRSSFDGPRSNVRRGSSQSFRGGQRGRPSFDGERSNDRRGDSQSFRGARSPNQRGRSVEPDSYYDDERFKRPRNNVR